jgi:hypothetical protein
MTNRSYLPLPLWGESAGFGGIGVQAKNDNLCLHPEKELSFPQAENGVKFMSSRRK